MNKQKCPCCGGYLPNRPLYFYQRPQGILAIWLCPNCRSKVQKWSKIE